MTIRPYNKRDFRYVQDICVATSWLAEQDNAVNRALLCSLYCDYYLDNEPEFCFVAVDDDDIPVGYVLCSANLDMYRDLNVCSYLPLVRKLDSSAYYEAVAQQKVESRYTKQGYTSHIHIDILPEYQRQGIGTQLIAAISERLAASFVEGMYLICSLKNKVARSFYEKLGFEDIDYIGGAVVYGKKLFKEDDETV